jgi:hypothetical protein
MACRSRTGCGTDSPEGIAARDLPLASVAAKCDVQWLSWANQKAWIERVAEAGARSRDPDQGLPPCTTFDKWRLLYVVDDDYTVTEAIRTFF